jgi:NADPH:quinone reductase-like Zn-dependent oxidoreductase
MNTNVMKALRFAQFGPPSVSRIEEVAIPEPGEGEAVVRLRAAAINPSDIGNVAGVSRAQLCREHPAATLRALS